MEEIDIKEDAEIEDFSKRDTGKTVQGLILFLQTDNGYMYHVGDMNFRLATLCWIGESLEHFLNDVMPLAISIIMHENPDAEFANVVSYSMNIEIANMNVPSEYIGSESDRLIKLIGNSWIEGK